MRLSHIPSATALALVLSLTSACATARDHSTVAQVDGRRIAYRVLGSGAPVVVMITGLGDDMTAFEDVATDLSRDATVIIYDRAGYGASTRAAGLRDAEAADGDLSAVLAQTGVRGPYIVLGHSLGGLFAEYYAARHPDQVAGLILEESRPADFTRRCLAAGVKMCVAPAAMLTFAPDGAKSELAALPATAAEVEAIGPVREKPVLVLSRPAGAKPSPFDLVWSADQDDLAARYPGARHLIAPPSGHYLHTDQKAWFVASVRTFIAETPGWGRAIRPLDGGQTP